MSRSSYLKPDTVALHTGYVPESDHGSRAVPIYQTTSYVFESVSDGSSLFNVEQGGHIYSRITNPTVAVLEQRIAALEGGSGTICTASGMSALFTAFITLASNETAQAVQKIDTDMNCRLDTVVEQPTQRTDSNSTADHTKFDELKGPFLSVCILAHEGTDSGHRA